MRQEIEQRLQQLSPETPWAHWFEFAPGLFSVAQDNPKYFRKATGLKKVEEALLSAAQVHVDSQSLQGKRVLDLACGEGGHSISFARQGASVIGVEGRKLYVERARFAAEVLAVSNVEFVHGDVRRLHPDLGTFDIVIFSGILHHLGVEDFDEIVRQLGRLASDLLLLYTHTCTETSVKNHRLEGPVKTPRGREGYLFREHQDGDTRELRESRIRSSLDNTFSFWVREQDLVESLREAGFYPILKVMLPHPFNWEEALYRPILVAKKTAIEPKLDGLPSRDEKDDSANTSRRHEVDDPIHPRQEGIGSE